MKTTDTIEDGVSEGLPVRHIEAFLEQLRAARYAEETLLKKRWTLTAFARWMKSKNITLVHLDESAIAALVKRSTDAPATRVQFELAVLRLLLAYLRSEAIARLPAPHDESAIDHIHGRYVDYCGKIVALRRIRCSSTHLSFVISLTVRMLATAV
jgi:integrase/recombinase XerD